MTEPRLTELAHGGGCGCKVAPAALARILEEARAASPMPFELLVGNEGADDAAVYRLNDEQAVVATTDFFLPIVDDPEDFGRIAAANALSDVYAMGARPIFALAIVGMPLDRLSPATIGAILRGGQRTCEEAGIPIAGGHTIDVGEPIYGLAAIGVVHPGKVKTNAGAQPGDVLLLGKPIGVGVMSAAFKKGALDDEGYRRLIATTTRLNLAGMGLGALPDVHAMTDVTGFGLAGHALEMARASKLRLRIVWDRVALLPGVRELAANGFITGASGRNWASYGEQVEHQLDPVGQALLADPQTSGGLLCAVAPGGVHAALSAFESAGLSAVAVGEVFAAAPGLEVV